VKKKVSLFKKCFKELKLLNFDETKIAKVTFEHFFLEIIFDKKE
jgi:hypothetical protein